MRVTDEKMDIVIGTILRIGVLSAALVVAAGVVFYLRENGGRIPDYSVFHPFMAFAPGIRALAGDVAALKSTAMIQLGLLLLIATPLLRVVFSFIAFILQRDILYTVVTLIVLVVLCISLLGKGGG